MASSRTCQLYLITPPNIITQDALAGFVAPFTQSLEAGAIAAVQLRLKDVDAEIIGAVTRVLMPLAHDAGAVFIINDAPEYAHHLGADGCHIGQMDGDYAHARAVLGGERIIGVTCHNSRHLAMVAGEAGADYVSFGAFYPSSTKGVKHFAQSDILSWWQEVAALPCVAIGGITPSNAAPLVEAGADFLAISAGVWAHEAGVGEAVAAFHRLLAISA